MADDRQVKIVRILVYEGSREWVKRTLESSVVQPHEPFCVANGSEVRELLRFEEPLP